MAMTTVIVVVEVVVVVAVVVVVLLKAVVVISVDSVASLLLLAKIGLDLQTAHRAVKATVVYSSQVLTPRAKEHHLPYAV